MPPKKRKQVSSQVKKKVGRTRGSKQIKKRKKNPWDSSSEDEQRYEEYNYYSDEEGKNGSDDYSDEDIKNISLKNKNKVSVIDGLEEEIDDGFEFDDDDDDGNESEELSTTTSSLKFSYFDTGREKRCVWLEDRDVPHLDLPESSEDLLLDSNLVLRALEIYEICRRFGSIIRLSPFLFEDFCATLNATNEQSPLLDEIHIGFIKLLLKEDEINQTMYGAFDTRDSINIVLNHLDFMTYGEILRRYVESDERFGAEILSTLTDCNYPFVDVEKRLIVLKWLCDQFLITNTLRNELATEGVIKHDDHCRECGKTGDLLCCDTCSAVYHLSCVDPPLKETPSSGWQCSVCKLHILPGVTDIVPEFGRPDQLIRQNFLGYDRHGRCYWYLCRRIFAEDDVKQVWYCSTLAQFRQLLVVLDANDLERELCEVFSQFSKDILRGLEMNEQLTNGRKVSRQTWFAVDKKKRMEVFSGDSVISNSQPTELLLKINNALNESFDEIKKLGINESPCVELEDISFASSDGLADKIPIRSAQMRIAPKPNPDLVESSSVPFKLGMDKTYMKYNNYYSTNTLAMNPYQRADERKWERYISNRFSIDGEAQYNWPKEVMNSSDKCAKFIRNCLVNISSRLPLSLMHPLWGKDVLLGWKQRINESLNVADFATAVLKFESNIKPIVFNDSYKHSLGHTRLVRQTVEDKEERRLNDKAKQKRQQALTERLTSCDPSDENSSVIWVKYSLLDGPPKHEIWKIKDEQYRVNGLEKLGGWIWVRSQRRINYTSYRDYGLFKGPLWESSHSSVIEQMLHDYRIGVFRYDIDDENEFVDDGQPSCADIPMTLNCETMELEINRPKAAAKFCFNQHLDTINVSQAVSRHSLYFKVAKGSKILDKLLSARIRQEEKLNAAVTFRCYSPTCFATNGSPTCYSVVCRSRFFVNERRTRLKHRLRTNLDDTVDGASSSTSAKNDLDDDKILRTPPLHFFRCRRSQKLNIFILPKHVSRKLARNWFSNEEIHGFNNNSKANPIFWPYPCVRPFFSTCWKYQMAKASSLHAVALMLRVLFSSIRWSDVLKNVGLDARRSRRFEEYTETREIVKHKSLPPFGLTQSYMGRIICVPHAYGNGKDGYSDETSDEDYDPHNTSYKLRERRREREKLMNKIKSKNNNKPTVTIQWIREEDLVMWEVRNYWSTTERNRKIKEIETARRLKESNQTNLASQSTSFRSATPGMSGITVKSNIIRTPTSLAAVSRTSFQTPSSMPMRFINRPAIAPTPVATTPRLVLAAGSRLITVNKMPTPISTVGGTQSAVRPSLVFVVRSQTGNQQAVRFSSNNLPVVKKFLNFGGSSNVIIRPGTPNQQQQSQPTTTFIQPQRPIQQTSKFYLTNGGEYSPMSTSTPSSAYYGDTKQIADEHGFVLTPSAVQQAIKKGLLGADNKETKNKLLSLKKRNVPVSPPPDINFGHFETDEDEEENFEDDDYDFDFDNIPNLQPAVPNARQRRPLNPKLPRSLVKTPRRISNPNRSSSSGGRRKKIVDDPSLAFDTVSRGRRKKYVDDDDASAFSQAVSPLSRSRKKFDDDLITTLPPLKGAARRDETTYQSAEEHRINRKITSDCMVLMRYLVDKVCEKEKSERRSEKRAMSSELRRQYWKRYRVKRKIKLQYEDQISNRLARWRKEIVKRRQLLEFEICSVAQKDLDNGGLEALKIARESKKEKRLQTNNILLNHNDGKRKRKSSESLKYKTPKKSSAHMKISTSSVKLDVGSVKKSSSKQPKILPVVGQFSGPLQSKFDERIRDCAPDTSCLCKKSYDPTKFYVGCDLCSRYFHGKCVGVTSQISKRISVWYCPDCQRERQNAKQELYCICRTPYDESQFYISCDVCDLWFHGKCVGIKPDEGDDMPAFICQECSRNQNGTIQPMIKPLTNRDVQRAKDVVDLLEKHKMSWPFRRAVDFNSHPKYLRIVQDPMDLSMIKLKTTERRYHCLAEFTNDVSLIFNNARKYFPPESAEFQCATVLDRYFSDRLHELKQEMIKEIIN